MRFALKFDDEYRAQADFSQGFPSASRLTAGDWVEGELSSIVERPMTHFEDEKNFCATKFNFQLPISLSLT